MGSRYSPPDAPPAGQDSPRAVRSCLVDDAPERAFDSPGGEVSVVRRDGVWEVAHAWATTGVGVRMELAMAFDQREAQADLKTKCRAVSWSYVLVGALNRGFLSPEMAERLLERLCHHSARPVGPLGIEGGARLSGQKNALHLVMWGAVEVEFGHLLQTVVSAQFLQAEETLGMNDVLSVLDSWQADDARNRALVLEHVSGRDKSYSPTESWGYVNRGVADACQHKQRKTQTAGWGRHSRMHPISSEELAERIGAESAASLGAMYDRARALGVDLAFDTDALTMSRVLLSRYRGVGRQTKEMRAMLSQERFVDVCSSDTLACVLAFVYRDQTARYAVGDLSESDASDAVGVFVSVWGVTKLLDRGDPRLQRLQESLSVALCGYRDYDLYEPSLYDTAVFLRSSLRFNMPSYNHFLEMKERNRRLRARFRGHGWVGHQIRQHLKRAERQDRRGKYDSSWGTFSDWGRPTLKAGERT